MLKGKEELFNQNKSHKFMNEKDFKFIKTQHNLQSFDTQFVQIIQFKEKEKIKQVNFRFLVKQSLIVQFNSNSNILENIMLNMKVPLNKTECKDFEKYLNQKRMEHLKQNYRMIYLCISDLKNQVWIHNKSKKQLKKH